MAEGRDSLRSVFLTDSVDVECSDCSTEDRLRWLGSELLPFAQEATASGEEFLVDVGPQVGGHVVGVPVQVRLGPSWTRNGSAAIPIRWEAVNLGSLFPVLDGTLLITPLEEGRCRIAMEACYRPPLGGLGEFLDRAILHRIAASTIRSFLARMAERLTA